MHFQFSYSLLSVLLDVGLCWDVPTCVNKNVPHEKHPIVQMCRKSSSNWNDSGE